MPEPMTGRSLSPEMVREAAISECGQYRYTLHRRWSNVAPVLRFVMLNPSTADATLDDPTIRRCIGFAKRDGYGAIAVLNLYAYRATDPKALLTCADAVGPANDEHLTAHLNMATLYGDPVVAAWGANARLDRVGRVLNLVGGVDWRCLGTTKQGAPKHPLYIKGDQPLVPYLWADVTAPARTPSADDALCPRCWRPIDGPGAQTCTEPHGAASPKAAQQRTVPTTPEQP